MSKDRCHRISSAATAVMVISLALIAGAARAQIVANPMAPGANRPQVLVAPNGVGVVNITSPSAAGVSLNRCSQFDVNGNGAILNNSRTATQSMLGGWIAANPWLSTGPAHVIVNQVDSSNPSHLRGYVEVAGNKADVVIANPSGIAIDGGGFLNASQVTLTTGTPQWNALGGLDGFVVRGGAITIDGAGLDASKTDYAAILARAVQLNAALYASDLEVVTGANQLSGDRSRITQITPAAGTGTAPAFALDVAQLGGMYAGKIVLVGTEAGLGVRNAGMIQVAPGVSTNALSGIGQLVITTSGRLENTGTIRASSDTSLTAAALGNSGTIASATQLKIATQGDFANSLNGTGGTSEAQRIDLASAGGNIDNRLGTIRQASSAGLALTAAALSNGAAGVIGPEPRPVAPPSSGAATGSAGASGAGDGGVDNGTSAGGGTGTAAVSPPYVPPSPGRIAAAGAILNDGGKIYAAGSITLQSANVSNAGGSLHVASMTLDQPVFSNRGGTLDVDGAFNAKVGGFDNASGVLRAGSLNIADAGDLVNTGGTLAGNSGTTLSVDGQLVNAQGQIASGAGLAMRTGSLEGSRGTLQAGSDMRVTATRGLTATGTNVAAGNMALQAASIDLSGSQTGAASIQLAATQGDITTSGATVATPGALAITSSGATRNVAGKLQSGGALVLSSVGLDNSAGTISGHSVSVNTQGQAFTNGAGTLVSDTTADLQTGALMNDGGLIQSGAATTIGTHGGSFDNTRGQTQAAGDLTIDAGAGHLTNASGALRAGNDITVVSGGVVDNRSRSNAHECVKARRHNHPVEAAEESVIHGRPLLTFVASSALT